MAAEKAEKGHMRASMPAVSAWIDALREAFGHEDVTLWIRAGLDDGTFYAAENGCVIGQAPAGALNAVSAMENMVLEPAIAPPAPVTRIWAGRAR